MSSMQDYEVKTGVWGLPSVDETIRIIRHDARHHAGRRLAQQGPAAASVQENMLVIAPGTAQEGFVTRLQDGLLKPDSRAAPAPVSLRKHSGYHEDAWTSTRDHTCQIIKNHLRATLRTSPDTLTGEINALLAKAPILAAINEAASQAATDALGANQRGVRLRMDQAIREFLGESTVRKVLQTFGNNAVLGDVNPALQDNVQKARRICPNAVLLLAKTGWANARMARTRVPEWGNDMKSIQPDNTPRQIIDKAHQLFFQQFGSTTAANTDSQEAAWQMFLRLDPETIRRCPAPWKPVRLIRRAQEAGVEPTRGAAITVLSCLKGNGETPMDHPAVIRAFLKECANSTPEGERATDAQFRRLAEIPWDRGKNEEAGERLAPHGRETPEWSSVLKILPEAQDAGTPAGPARKVREKAPATPRRRSLSSQEALEILRGPVGQDVMHAVRQDVGVAHRPGERTTLTVRGKTVIDVRRSPGGFLQFNGEEWARNLTVPNPRGGNPHWCTRGAAMQSLEEHGTRMLQTSLAPQESLSKRRAEKALHEFAQTDLGGLDPQLSGRLLTGVQSMVDQEAWMLAQSRSAHVTLDGYNTALGAMRHLKELLESNPAALEWALAYAEPREEIHHPGQIIELARRSSEQAGLPAGSWRRTSGIPARIVRGIIEKANPMGAAAILGAIARSGAVPEKQIALAALQVLVPKGQRSVPGETTVRLRFELTVRVQAGPGANGEPVPENAARRREQQREQQREKQREQNLERVLRLLFRESARERSSNQRAAQRAIADELPDLRDYLNARNSQELPVRATTWRGLLKASRAWHQEMRIAPIRQRWANILAARGGQYLRWAMPTGNIELDGTEPGQLEIDGLEIIPLLDEHALYEESLEMLHCVIQYGDRCASGKTLVVSLRENGERVATGEIVMTPQGWREQQTRGRRNHQGIDRARQAVQRLAEICNRNPTGAGIPG